VWGLDATLCMGVDVTVMRRDVTHLGLGLDVAGYKILLLDRLGLGLYIVSLLDGLRLWLGTGLGLDKTGSLLSCYGGNLHLPYIVQLGLTLSDVVLLKLTLSDVVLLKLTLLHLTITRTLLNCTGSDLHVPIGPYYLTRIATFLQPYDE